MKVILHTLPPLPQEFGFLFWDPGSIVSADLSKVKTWDTLANPGR